MINGEGFIPWNEMKLLLNGESLSTLTLITYAQYNLLVFSRIRLEYASSSLNRGGLASCERVRGPKLRKNLHSPQWAAILQASPSTLLGGHAQGLPTR